jgi:hypothetical protein
MNAQAPSHRATVLTLVTAALLLISTSAHAVFYTPQQNWQITGTGDYTVSSATFNGNAGVANTLTMVGPNSLSGNVGQLNVQTIPANQTLLSGSIYFDWEYAATDSRGNHDRAGYFLIQNGVTTTTELVRNAGGVHTFGSVTAGTINVQAGDTFGFWINSTDNKGGAPTFTITNFNAPLAAVPEASAFLTLAFAGLVVVGIARRRKAAR